jgi:hypothetical protein
MHRLMIVSQSTHLAYIIAAANLHAFNYGLKGFSDPEQYKKVAEGVIVPEFTPKSGVKVQVTENEPVQQEAGAVGKPVQPPSHPRCLIRRRHGPVQSHEEAAVAGVARRVPHDGGRVREG